MPYHQVRRRTCTCRRPAARKKVVYKRNLRAWMLRVWFEKRFHNCSVTRKAIIMVPSLTAGSINRILDGEDVSGAVVQILGCKKIPGTVNDRYRLLISDGVTGCPFVMLGTRFNSLVTNKELEKFTIIRVDKCVCNQVQQDKKVIILLNLAVLVPGSEVNEKIGNPTTATAAAPGGAVGNNQVESNNNENRSVFAGESNVGNPPQMNGSVQSVHPIASLTPYQNKWTLTAGSINRILDGEDVSGAVIQILGCKKIPGTGNDRYRLLISDGVTGCPFAMLGTQLNSLVTNKELEKFTIIRVDKCVCNQVQQDKKVIILLNLAVLVPGSEVKEKIGNPTTATAAAPGGAAGNNQVNGNNNESRSVFAGESNVGIPPHMNESVQSVHPIASLTPYQNKWTIKARVTNKTPIRTWSNSRGEGRLFSVNFLDESGEIRATGFNESVDKFYAILEINKVFYVSRATLKPANKNYSTVKNDYEMTFNSDTTVTPCEESSASIPMLQFDFVPIASIENIEKDTSIDVIGICKSAGDVLSFVAKTTNKELVKRDIKLVDQSNKEVSLTLWGSDAEKFDGSLNPVVAVKGAKVSDFNGRSLSVTMSSTMQINPDIQKAHFLKGWYDKEGCNMEMESLSGKGGGVGSSMTGQWKTFAQVSSEQIGMGDKPDYYVTKATVVLLKKENCMYMACPTDQCNKKVINMNNGLYRCEKCGREYTEFKWRLLLSVSLADFTENQWVTCFQEAAESILGRTAQELGSLKETDEDSFNEVFAEANFKSFIFKLRAKMETYNEESRLKTIIVTAVPVEPVSYTKKILADIKEMQKEL